MLMATFFHSNKDPNLQLGLWPPNFPLLLRVGHVTKHGPGHLGRSIITERMLAFLLHLIHFPAAHRHDGWSWQLRPPGDIGNGEHAWWTNRMEGP